MKLYNKLITKALIRLRGCAGWSAPLLFANLRRQVFSRGGPFILTVSHVLTLCMLGYFACFLSSANCFQNQHFWKILSGILASKDQAAWVQIRPNVLSGLIWSKLFAKVISRRHYIVGKGLSRFETKVAVSHDKTHYFP